MKSTKSILLGIFLLGSFASGAALADGFHHDGFHHDGFHGGYWHGGPRIGVYLGGPWPYSYAPYPYYGYSVPYYYPPEVTVERPAPVYIEKGSEKADWFYCSNPSGYYPYVKQCPSGWQRVPQVPPQ